MKVACVILCAGESVRMRSNFSKLLHDLGGKPILFWLLDKIVLISKGPIVAVVNPSSQALQAAIQKRYGSQVVFAIQKEALGSAHAVISALPMLQNFDGQVLIACGDVPFVSVDTLHKLCTVTKDSSWVMNVMTTLMNEPTGYGRIIRDAQGESVLGIVEEADATAKQREIKEVNAGLYVVEHGFLQRTLPTIKAQNKQGEYYLTDLVALANQEGKKVLSLVVSESETQGINNRKQLATALEIMQQRLRHYWMERGVTFMGPAYLEAEVVLAQDVVLEPNVMLKGSTVVDSGAHIKAGSILSDCHVQSEAIIEPYCVCEGARIGKNTRVGPFAHLRPGADLHEHVKIGNFVEVKKSVIKKGAKAGHLAYIGDAQIGQNVNIGAGVITCNYDGKNKNTTIIEDGAFIGSNVSLIAPISVGKNAYVAGGSTVNKKVEDNALAIGRSKQVNKPNWVKK